MKSMLTEKQRMVIHCDFLVFIKKEPHISQTYLLLGLLVMSVKHPSAPSEKVAKIFPIFGQGFIESDFNEVKLLLKPTYQRLVAGCDGLVFMLRMQTSEHHVRS